MSGKVVLAGAGPGDPGLLTLRAAQTLREAEVLLYDALASESVIALAPASCERIYVGKRGGEHAMEQRDIQALMIRKARDGKRVVRLKGGDPFVFGRGGEEAQALREAGIAFEVVPGITSAIAAPAYAGIPVTHRSANTAFTVLTGHEDPGKAVSTLDFARLADPHQTLVFLMAMGNLRRIAEQLIANGLPADRPAAVIRDGTRPSQQTLVSTLATVAQDAARAQLDAPSIVVIGDVVRLRDSLRWFDTSPLFGKRVLVTRPRGQHEAFASALLAHGALPVVAPTIEIVAPEREPAAQAVLADLTRYRWLVLTSQNGVAAFFDALRARGRDARALHATRVAAIGSKTAQALGAHGIAPDLVPAEYVAESLAEALLAQSAPGDRLLLYRAAEARDLLVDRLRAQDREVDVVHAYRTAFTAGPDFAQRVTSCDALTFTSASTVRGFAHAFASQADALAAARGKVVACIGPITAAAAREIGLHVDAVASVYTTEGLIDALRSAFTPS